jgi:hypothetical protein
LAFGPYALFWYLVVAKSDILSLVLWSGIFYILTQIIVILLLATFLTEPEVESEFVLLHEIGRTIISGINLVAIYMILNSKQARTTNSNLRTLGVGFGWSTANCLLGVAFPLIYSAGSNEFNWENPMKALGCSVTLLSTLATVGFVENLKRDRFNLISIVFIVFLTCQPSLTVYLNSLEGIEQLYVLVVNIILGWLACFFAGLKLEE